MLLSSSLYLFFQDEFFRHHILACSFVCFDRVITLYDFRLVISANSVTSETCLCIGHHIVSGFGSRERCEKEIQADLGSYCVFLVAFWSGNGYYFLLWSP